MQRRSVFILVILAGLLVANPVAVYAAPGTTERVSVASDGTQTDGVSLSLSMSADGRYVVYDSYASNLVPGDNNSSSDVFMRDLVTGGTTRISVASDGTAADDYSGGPSISADDRYVTFSSWASNVVPGDTNGVGDVFVRDLVNFSTTRVSVATDGTQGNDHSGGLGVSADGRYVAFGSDATNLVAGDTNLVRDAFVRDLVTGTTTRVSVASDGTQADRWTEPVAISADGRFVALRSQATNLVPGDTNEADDTFVHDRVTGATTRVSVASDGTQADRESDAAGISGDGRYVAFRSYASNLVPGDTNDAGDVFVRDRDTGLTTRVSVASEGVQANGQTGAVTITSDGRYVAFPSAADNLVSGDTNGTYDAFVHDRNTGMTTRVNVASDGAQANGFSEAPELSADGRLVAFASEGTNLVAGDTNGMRDVFVHEQGVVDSRRASATAVTSNRARFSKLGEKVTFTATVRPATLSGIPSGSGIPGRGGMPGVPEDPSIKKVKVTGTVQFRIDGANVGAPVAIKPNGRATYATSALTVGKHSASAVFSGNASLSPSTSMNITQLVR